MQALLHKLATNPGFHLVPEVDRFINRKVDQIHHLRRESTRLRRVLRQIVARPAQTHRPPSRYRRNITQYRKANPKNVLRWAKSARTMIFKLDTEVQHLRIHLVRLQSYYSKHSHQGKYVACPTKPRRLKP